jgi:hypothetical protein
MNKLGAPKYTVNKEAGEYGANRVLGGEVVETAEDDWEVPAAGE